MLEEELTALLPNLLEMPQGQLVDEWPVNVTILADDATALSVVYYEELLPNADFVAEAFEDPTLETRLQANARFALGESDTASFLERSGVRAIYDQARSTLIHNTEREGGKWYRIPSADACGFCRLLATRGPVYKSAHAAAASHDKCKCRVAVERPGMSHTRPAYMNSWNDDYRRIRSAVIKQGKEPSLDNIANAWTVEVRREQRALGVDITENVA